MSSQSLKIIHCLRDPVGGSFRHVRDLIDEQSANGHQIGLICDAAFSDEHNERLLKQLEAKLALGLHRFEMSRNISLSDIKNIWLIRRILQKLCPEIVHNHTFKCGFFGRLGNAFRSNKASCIYSPHGGVLHLEKKGLASRVVFFTERFLEFFTKKIVFVCDFERQVYCDKVGVPKCGSSTIHNGLVESDFDRVELNPNKCDFIFIGMMRDLKGPDLFIKALSKTQASAIMVGEGPDLHRYQSMVKGLELQHRVTFLPHMKTRNAFAMAECVVVPSRAESFPYIVLEAIAARRSLIASDVGGISEIAEIAPFEMVPADDYHQLADKMSSHLSNVVEPDLLTLRSHALKGKFSASIMASQIEDIYLATLS